MIDGGPEVIPEFPVERPVPFGCRIGGPFHQWGKWSKPIAGTSVSTQPLTGWQYVNDTTLQRRFCLACGRRQLREAA